jgi:DNA-binding MarR family transcriptional regulator
MVINLSPYKAKDYGFHSRIEGMESDRPRNESGQYVTTRSPDAVLDTMEPLEPYTTGELADNLGWPRRTVYELLSTLEERGDVRKKKPEPRRAIWIRPEDTA